MRPEGKWQERAVQLGVGLQVSLYEKDHTPYRKMAFLVLRMPPCKMAQKSTGCPDCQYRSCMGLAERNVRLFRLGTISEPRLAELSQDLAQTCPLASCYESWLLAHMDELPVGKRLARRERREAVQQWLRQSCAGSAS